MECLLNSQRKGLIINKKKKMKKKMFNMVEKVKAATSFKVWKSSSRRSKNHYFPEEIMMEILTRLPVKSLIRFRSVCKAWHSLISHPYFVQLHLKQSKASDNSLNILFESFSLCSLSFDPSALPIQHDYLFKSHRKVSNFWGSCDGLIFIQVHKDILWLWNPSSRCYVELPSCPPVTVHSGMNNVSHKVAYGFGYDTKIEDYKFVKISSYCVEDINQGFYHFSEVQVLELKTSSWRRISDTTHTVAGSPGKLVNGALYWKESLLGTSTKLVCFDIEFEVFREVKLPVFDNNPGQFSMELAELAGYLALVYQYRNHLDVFVMKQNGKEVYWKKIFTVARLPSSKPFSLKPITILKDYMKIVFESNGSSIVSYNTKTDEFKRWRVVGVPFWGRTLTFVESLVLLDTNDSKIKRLL